MSLKTDVNNPYDNRNTKIVRKESTKANTQKYGDCFAYASVRAIIRLIMEEIKYPFNKPTGASTISSQEIREGLSSSISSASDNSGRYKIAYAHLQKYIMTNTIARFGCNGEYTPDVLIWIIEFLFNNVGDGLNPESGLNWDVFDFLKDDPELISLIKSLHNRCKYAVKIITKNEIEKYSSFSHTAQILEQVLGEPSNLYAILSISADESWWDKFQSINEENYEEITQELKEHTSGIEKGSHAVVIRDIIYDPKTIKYSLGIMNSWGTDWGYNGEYEFNEDLFKNLTDYYISFFVKYDDADDDAKKFTDETIKELKEFGLAMHGEIERLTALQNASESIGSQNSVGFNTQEDSYNYNVNSDNEDKQPDVVSEEVISTNSVEDSNEFIPKRIKVQSIEGGKTRNMSHKIKFKKYSNKCKQSNKTKRAQTQNKKVKTRKLHRNRRRNHTRVKLFAR